MTRLARRAAAAALLALSAACATKDGASGDTIAETRGTPPDGAAQAKHDSVVAATVPDTPAAKAPRDERSPMDKGAGSSTPGSSPGGAGVTGGPQRPPEKPRSSGCGGAYVNVTVTAAALEGTTLGRVAADLLAPVAGTVGAPSLSPAIRAFRAQFRDAASADRALATLRASAKVAAVERDGCEVMIER